MDVSKEKLKTIGLILLIIAMVIYALSTMMKKNNSNITQNTTDTIVVENEKEIDDDTRIVVTQLAMDYFRAINNSSEIINDIIDDECSDIASIDEVKNWEYKDLSIVKKDENVSVYKFSYNEDGEEKAILVKLYENGTTFSIYPYEYVKRNGVDVDLKKPLQNDNNIVTFVKDSEVSRADLYLNYYFDMVNNDIEDSMKMLEEEYKKSFSSTEEYAEFVEKIVKKKSMITSADKRGDHIEIKTISGIIYTIIEQDYMKFKLILDSYRIKNENYSKLANDKKGNYVCESFIQMMQLEDYKSIYDLLNYGFKANNFGTYSDLVNYLEDKNLTFDSYKINSRANTISKSYQYEIILYRNGIRLANTIDLIIRLIDNEKYEISFSIKE